VIIQPVADGNFLFIVEKITTNEHRETTQISLPDHHHHEKAYEL
jgi:hypothetical protein